MRQMVQLKHIVFYSIALSEFDKEEFVNLQFSMRRKAAEVLLAQVATDQNEKMSLVQNPLNLTFKIESKQELRIKSIDFMKQGRLVTRVPVNEWVRYADRLKWKNVQLPVQKSDLHEMTVLISFEVETGIKPFQSGVQVFEVSSNVLTPFEIEKTIFVFSIEKTHALSHVYEMKTLAVNGETGA